MSTEIVNTKTGVITEVAHFTPEQTELLKRTVGKDFTDDEFMVFLNVCKKVQLDPFSKQIYGIKYAGRLTIQTSIDGLRLVADRTKNYAPGKAATYTHEASDKTPATATAYVMKRVGDQWFEVSATAHIEEYMNANNQLWKKLPHAMLAKCAESQALRRAFPNETSGLYTTEEMSQAEKPEAVKMPKEIILPKNADIPIDEIKRHMQTPGIIESKEKKHDDQLAINAGVPPAPEIEFGGPMQEPADMDFTEPKKKSNSKFFDKLHAVAREKGLEPTKMKAAVKLMFNKNSSKDLSDEECVTLIAAIEKGAIRNG